MNMFETIAKELPKYIHENGTLLNENASILQFPCKDIFIEEAERYFSQVADYKNLVAVYAIQGRFLEAAHLSRKIGDYEKEQIYLNRSDMAKAKENKKINQ